MVYFLTGKDSMGPYDVHQLTYIAKPNTYFILFILVYKERPLILFGQVCFKQSSCW